MERELVLDGNAAAGALTAVFGEDISGADGECPHCGTVAKVGALVAFTHAPGIVLRCRSCDEIMLRIVETPRGTRVDVRARRLPPPE